MSGGVLLRLLPTLWMHVGGFVLASKTVSICVGEYERHLAIVQTCDGPSEPSWAIRWIVAGAFVVASLMTAIFVGELLRLHRTRSMHVGVLLALLVIFLTVVGLFVLRF